MKKLLLACMLATGLVACTNDDSALEQKSKNSDAISYEVSTQGITRASDIYCANNMPTSFNVSARQGTSTFFDGDVVTKDGSTWTTGTTRYWPESGALDFFAYANDQGTFTWDPATAPTFTNFKVNSDVATQNDLLYAVAAGQTKAANSDNVQLNFRHALSQIVFRAKNTNPNLYIEISGVSVVNVNGQGTFTFPTESTTTNVAHATASGTVPAAQGSWADLGTLSSYSVDINATPVTCIKGETENTSDIVNLTEYAAATDGSHGTETDFSKAMLLLPQTLAKAEIVKDSGTIPTTGVYFVVKCKIWNVANPSADGTKAADDVLLYPAVADGSTADATAAADVLIPVAIDWQQGMKYIYTFVFGEGNGGWNPNGPDPVLVPITYEVSVDEFIPLNGTDYNIDMKTE